jgi:hypothetical protein
MFTIPIIKSKEERGKGKELVAGCRLQKPLCNLQPEYKKDGPESVFFL